MRIFGQVFLLFTTTILSSLVFADEFSNYLQPFSPNPRWSLNVFRRSNSKCANNCSSVGENVCCGKQATCALDQAGNVACCPLNAVCTGTIGSLSGASVTVSGQSTAASAGATPTAVPSASISHAISGSSTVFNSYYPFPIAPTKFPNANDCSSTYSACQAESAKCTGFIEGGGYGVTINGGGSGGVTHQ